jgi:hypothetical protein
MGLEKDLTLQVVDVLAANVVPDQGERNNERDEERNNERDEALSIVVDELRQLSSRGGVQHLLHMASRVLEDVGVAPARGQL